MRKLLILPSRSRSPPARPSSRAPIPVRPLPGRRQINDPDFEAGPGDAVAGRFGGGAMTYYRRWTYKFEKAARHGNGVHYGEVSLNRFDPKRINHSQQIFLTTIAI